jgi:putative acetyltransferase
MKRTGYAGRSSPPGETMISVRPEESADQEAIRRVHVASFSTPAEARLVDLLRDAGHLSVSLVAVAGGVVVGHAAFSPVTAGTGPAGVGVAPVAVLREHRRRGIAGRLVERGIEDCRRAGFRWAVVLGDRNYYARFGFRAAAELGLLDEYGGGLSFQAMELVPRGLPVGAGLVRYAPAFASFSR